MDGEAWLIIRAAQAPGLRTIKRWRPQGARAVADNPVGTARSPPLSAPDTPPAHPPDVPAAHARLPRRRLAALSLAGALMVALPLGQVLRYQGFEQQALADQRAALDPITRAVEVQRGLIVHGTLASAVLRGRLTAEPERQLRQREVDQRLTALARTLSAGPWGTAAREGEALMNDWAELARQVASRTCSASQSDESHRLRVEQVLQVIDLLADALSALGANDGARQPWHAARGLPRRAALQAAGGGDDWSAPLASFEVALRSRAAAIESQQTQLDVSRRSLLATLLLLALGQAWLLRRLWQDTAAPAAPGTLPAADFGAPAHPDRATAGHLLQRLRRGEDTASAPLDTR